MTPTEHDQADNELGQGFECTRERVVCLRKYVKAGAVIATGQCVPSEAPNSTRLYRKQTLARTLSKIISTGGQAVVYANSLMVKMLNQDAFSASSSPSRCAI